MQCKFLSQLPYRGFFFHYSSSWEIFWYDVMEQWDIGWYWNEYMPILIGEWRVCKYRLPEWLFSLKYCIVVSIHFDSPR